MSNIVLEDFIGSGDSILSTNFEILNGLNVEGVTTDIEVSGNFTVPSDGIYAVLVIGGGGGGGVDLSARGSGGGSGYHRFEILHLNGGEVIPTTVGAGGSSASSGGSSSFGSYITALGGGGGFSGTTTLFGEGFANGGVQAGEGYSLQHMYDLLQMIFSDQYEIFVPQLGGTSGTNTGGGGASLIGRGGKGWWNGIDINLCKGVYGSGGGGGPSTGYTGGNGIIKIKKLSKGVQL